MGYTIVYQRAFVRTTRGIIPMILAGSNNWTQTIWDSRGRKFEKRERYWYNTGPSAAGDKQYKYIEYSEDLLLALAQQDPREPDAELFKYPGGKAWITKSQFANWHKNGIRTAHTLEEYLKWNSFFSFRCRLKLYPDKKEITHTEKSAYCKTTAELEAWIDMAKKEASDYEAATPQGEATIWVGFEGTGPQYCDTTLVMPPSIDGPVAVKIGGAILTERLSSKPRIFQSAEDVLKELGGNLDRFTVVSAESVLNPKEKHYVVYISEGSMSGNFGAKSTSKYLYVTLEQSRAHRYRSFRDAETAAKRVLKQLSPVRVKAVQVWDLKTGTKTNIAAA